MTKWMQQNGMQEQEWDGKNSKCVERYCFKKRFSLQMKGKVYIEAMKDQLCYMEAKRGF